MKLTGIITALHISSKRGLPKHLQQFVTVAQYGFLGDFHNKPMRRSFSKPGTFKPNNDRHITIISEESLDYANQKLVITLKPGDLAENITTRGMGDLSDVPVNAVVRIKSVRLRVTGQNKPCRKVWRYHRQLKDILKGRRGLLCVVVVGIGERIGIGDSIEILWS